MVPLGILRYKKENPLACRVLFYVLVFSSCVTLAATAWQLYINFKKDLDYIEKRISQIKEGYGQGLSLGVWDLDTKQIHTLLGGIIELPDIQYLEIRDTADEIVAFLGTPKEQKVMIRAYPLDFIDSQGIPHHLGKFAITASLVSVYQRLNETVFQILISQTIKTFLVSGFILLVIRHFITRHLSAIAQYMSQEKLGYLETPIQLSRTFESNKDELELVVCAINRMRKGLIQYISERDLTEEKLNNTRNYIDGIINSMPSILVGVCSKGRVTQWNDGAQTLTGVSKREALGRSVYTLLANSDMPMESIKSAIIGQQFLKKTNISLSKEGQVVFYDIAIYPLSFSDQRGAVIRMDNVTERVKIEEIMIHNEKMHSVGMLAAGVAHEINNPTNSVINLAQIIMNDNTKESQEYDIARRITKEGERIARIVSSLLSFSRNAREEKKSARVQDILVEALALTEAQICKEGTKLVYDIPNRLPLIRANAQQIQQVFLNIINNSQFALNKKYPGFHPDKILEIQCREHLIHGKQFLRIVIKDHGTGIAQNILAKVNSPFFTTKPPGIGTGLGLSISCGIIESHRGFFNIESHENNYTRVTIDLPYDPNNPKRSS
ncbi:MAG: PAS domain S-box protein [Deltaproteobacteria bacterium]|uniref:ATP-binding protein n=1 Tax=Desulfobacula sp. TaxID=2593537 RepID=UPI00199B159E|nr:PAS domain S-box protein [Candidatus Desulfobacula maris]MBL6995742.1 PAS domain S-box protein [Desulfobacula sp.]